LGKSLLDFFDNLHSFLLEGIGKEAFQPTYIVVVFLTVDGQIKINDFQEFFLK
jgi:hypothetical protein